MYCEECGQKLDGSPHQCKQVQSKIAEPQSVIPKVEKTVTLKKKNLMIGIAISGLILSAIVILVGVMLLRGNTLACFLGRLMTLKVF